MKRTSQALTQCDALNISNDALPSLQSRFKFLQESFSESLKRATLPSLESSIRKKISKNEELSESEWDGLEEDLMEWDGLLQQIENSLDSIDSCVRMVIECEFLERGMEWMRNSPDPDFVLAGRRSCN
ncbi:hypothetical protein HDU97_004725 [Phlyctochytrium planicorne]|nr:hypothetical protein HDU97_004725 [Phlyctochytrium planicorne]